MADDAARRGSVSRSSSQPNSARQSAMQRRRSVVGRHRSNRSSKAAAGKGGADGGAATPADKVVVYNENGVDVTPRPLTVARLSTGYTGADGSDGVNSDSDSVAEKSSMGFSRSGGYSHSSDGESTDGDRAADGDSLIGPSGGGKGALAAGGPVVVVGPTITGKPLTEAHLAAKVVRILEETNTITMLDIPSRCVAADDPAAEAIAASNEAYAKLLQDKVGSENYVPGYSQTIPVLRKNKELHVPGAKFEVAQCTATAWDIADAFKDGDEAKEDEEQGALAPVPGAEAAAPQRSTGTSSLDASLAASSDFLSLVASAAGGEDGDEDALPKVVPLSEVGGLGPALAFMERAVTQNAYHDRLLQYRDFRLLGAPAPNPDSQSLDLLWRFSCDLTKGRQVTCLAWNKVRRDVLAVGYGQLDFGDRKTGLVAFWSLKNPEYPESWFECATGVTALDWSLYNPCLLAVGLYDGGIAIYDGRVVQGGEPVLEATHQSGKHSDPVWQVEWVDRGSERGEALVSVSSDGRVVEWSTSKGLEHTELMRLKSLGPKKAVKLPKDEAMSNALTKLNSKTEAFISRKASGMSISFSTQDPNVYLVGTEEGLIHRCSCSYSEQYLETFRGHNGPVYNVAWSPFSDSGHFLSASSDWSTRLWMEGREEPVLTFQSGSAAISDMSWSPTNSTVFASTSTDGRVEVWDVEVNTMKPILTYSSPSVKFSSLLFGSASPVLVAGGSDGAVCVFRLEGIERPEEEFLDGRKRLSDALSSVP